MAEDYGFRARLAQLMTWLQAPGQRQQTQENDRYTRDGAIHGGEDPDNRRGAFQRPVQAQSPGQAPGVSSQSSYGFDSSEAFRDRMLHNEAYQREMDSGYRPIQTQSPGQETTRDAHAMLGSDGPPAWIERTRQAPDTTTSQEAQRAKEQAAQEAQQQRFVVQARQRPRGKDRGMGW